MQSVEINGRPIKQMEKDSKPDVNVNGFSCVDYSSSVGYSNPFFEYIFHFEKVSYLNISLSHFTWNIEEIFT